MKSTSILATITIILASTQLSSAQSNPKQKECGENEEFVTCHSSSCFDETCEYLGLPRRCTRDCKAGCACVKDYVREPDGKCYHKSVCDKGDDVE